MTSVTIRRGSANDIPALLDLIRELALFEKAPESVTNTSERMKNEQEHFHFFVAESSGTIVGYALYFFAYYSWVGKSLYLDDLCVKPDFRNQGIGTRLLQKVFRIAQKEDCQRVRWQVLDWNDNAIAVYKKVGADIASEWLNCDFDRAKIESFSVTN